MRTIIKWIKEHKKTVFVILFFLSDGFIVAAILWLIKFIRSFF